MTISLEELQLATRNHGMPAGLHYLLIHYDVPVVDVGHWRLEVGGHVERPLSLSLDDLRLHETVTFPVTMECAGNGRARLEPRPISQPWLNEAVGTAEWTGTPLAGILGEAGIREGAVDIVFTGLDRGVEGGVEQSYARGLPLGSALAPDVLLAWGMNGHLLPPQHGFPLRLVVPGWYGMTSVKWLARIDVIDRPFDGYQNVTAYRYRRSEADPGEPVTRMFPRSLIAPPGIPDFMSRRRFLEPGPCLVEGRAWSGLASIAGVEVSADGGATWAEARLDKPVGRHAWRRFSWEWDARPGEHELCARCWDAEGNRQPDEHAWNVGGYAVNTVHRVPVSVR